MVGFMRVVNNWGQNNWGQSTIVSNIEQQAHVLRFAYSIHLGFIRPVLNI